MENKYYTIRECFEACGDDDFMIHEETEKFGNLEIKKKNAVKCSFTWFEINSDKWQIKRAEPKVLTAGEDFYLHNYTQIGDCQRISKEGHARIFKAGDKNGQLREWLRPEQVALRDAVKTVLNNHFGWDIDAVSQKKIQLLEYCFKNLKQPTTE